MGREDEAFDDSKKLNYEEKTPKSSLEEQMELIVKLCESMGWEIVTVYEGDSQVRRRSNQDGYETQDI